MLKKILIGVVALVAILLVVIAMQPKEFRVTRSVTIDAPPDTVFTLVNDFQRWNAWSPWAKLDTAMKTTLSTPPAGAGAVYTWVGNSEVGEGKMTITDSRPNELVGIKLEFLKPFAATSRTDFQFKGAGNQTTVDWIMTGENNFLSKAVCLFMGGMDKMMGPQFDQGLAQIKRLAEHKG